ncbi:hypothetical protein TeGR_g7308, partial [Tetraparma gracilis]
MSSPSSVTLAIYDLSSGLAASLSLPLLGVSIPLVPHTGVLLNGEEFFFGGGIQRTSHRAFQARFGGAVLKYYVDLGRTAATPADVDAWLSANAHRYTAARYRLLEHNCNNFADDFARSCLGTARGVPREVLDVPRVLVGSLMGRQMTLWLEGFYVLLAAQALVPPP